MAWTTMHFAMGMGCAGAATGIACAVARRGWRLVPPAMTLGGVWAVAPDLPRLFREDFPSLPFAAVLGDRDLEKTMHAWGDLFFFHAHLDASPHEYALHGLVLILLFYNAAIAGLLWGHRRRGPRLPAPETQPTPRRRRRHRAPSVGSATAASADTARRLDQPGSDAHDAAAHRPPPPGTNLRWHEPRSIPKI